MMATTTLLMMIMMNNYEIMAVGGVDYSA